MQGRAEEASAVLQSLEGADGSEQALAALREGLLAESSSEAVSWRELFQPSMRLVLILGVTVGILQQITGINAVFYYAPMIFEQSGIGTNAAFMQAVLVGLTNVVFTILALLLIDRLGRRVLLSAGLVGIALSMLTLAYGFSTATYQLDQAAIAALPAEMDRPALEALADSTYFSDLAFREAVSLALGAEQFTAFQAQLTGAAIQLNSVLILTAILAFVASFAVSIGPVMWVLFSELFPNRLRGKAISFAGLINSSIAFLVTFLFPWELETVGIANTFLIYGLFAACGVVFVIRLMPETKGRSLEQLERDLVEN
jgi:MFS family permease